MYRRIMNFNLYLQAFNWSGLLLIISAFMGCSNTYMSKDYSDKAEYEDLVNSKLKGQFIEIRVMPDSMIYADNVSFTKSRDSISFLEMNISSLKDQDNSRQSLSLQKKKIPVSNVISLSYTDRTRGFFKGLGIGCLTGATLGLFVMDISPDESISGKHPNAAANATAGMLMGGVIGAVIGAIVGDNYEYQITPIKQETNK